MKKIAIVDLLGGFGNQVIQISFAKYLEDSGFIVRINPYQLKNKEIEKKRNLELNLESFGFKSISFLSYLIFEMIKKLFYTRLLNRFFNSRYNTIFKIFEGQHLKKDFSFINRFTGYWQSEDHIINNQNYIRESLSKNNKNINQIEKNELNQNIMVHIRRTDYEDISEEINDKYYLEALKFTKKNFKIEKYDIFTDLNAVPHNNKIFENANNIYLHDGLEDTINTFTKMANYKYFIIANSSFSYLASIMSMINNKVVLYPSPWFKNSNFEPFIPKDWVKIDSL